MMLIIRRVECGLGKTKSETKYTRVVGKQKIVVEGGGFINIKDCLRD